MWLEHQKYPNVAANITTFRLLLHPKAFIISENSKTSDYCKLKMCIVAIGNPERHMRKASHCGSKQQ